MELTGVKISLRRKGARTAGALHSTGVGQGVSASMAGEISTLTQRLEGLRSLLIPVASDGAELDYSQAFLAVRLKSRLDLYSEGNLSALGATTDAGTGGTGGGGSLFGLMRDWPATDPGKSTEDALGANLGWELRQGLADARTLLDTHVADSVRHITGSERTRWNKAATDLSAIMGSDGDNVLNKWEEIVAFLATYTEADTLANLLSNKADKSQLAGYVTLDTEQKISGQKIFGTHMLIDCPRDTHDRYLFFREGGTSTYGGYVKYCGDDRLRIGTRNGDETVDIDAIEIKRGSTKVWLKGDVDIAGYTTVGNGLSVTGTVTADTIKRRGGTSLQLLTADGGIRTLHTLGAVGTLGWSGTSGQVVSINTLAHWDGRFAGGSGNSNLLYCAKGAFGDIVTRNTADFTVWAHGHNNTAGTQYILLGVCPPTSDSTYDSLHITGDFGGFDSDGKCAVDVYVGRRNGTHFRGFVNHESPEKRDIGINDAGEVYLILHHQWCAYNLNLFALQAEIKWDGKVSTPTDTNFVLLSESDSVAHFNDIRFKGISNVAVRLERVSRLWGRPFDGTGDVTGSLTSVADITMSGKLTIGGCEITWDAAQGALRFSTSAYSEGEMAGKGATSGSGSSSGGTTGGGSYDRLDSWAAYSADKAGYVLSALLGYDLHTRLTQAASDISSLRSSVSANAGGITALGNRLTAIEGLDIAELSDIEAAKTAVKNDVAKLYVTALGTRGDVVLWYKNGVENMLAVPYATESSRLRSVVSGDISTIRYHRLTYLSSAVPLGTGAGQAREGSHPEFGTWSYPKKGVYTGENDNANIQALRLTWSGGYFHEIMTSPNYNDLWHRSVNNGKAGEWERFITTGNMYRYLGESFRLRRRYSVDLSHLDTGTFYPVLFAGDKLELDCEISSPHGAGTDPWDNNHIHFLLTSWGWTDVRTTFSMLSCGNYDNNEITIGSVLRGTKQGFSCVFLRGGIIYDVIANREPELKETGYTGYTGEAYMPGADITGGDNVSTQVLWRNDSTRDEKTVVVRETLTNELATLGNSLRSEAASKYVTLSTGQTITGIKRFAPECLRVEGEHSQNYISILHSVNTGIPTADRDYRWTIYHAADGSNFRGLAIWSYDGDGKRFNPVARFESVPENALRVFGKITAHRFVREGGTSAMFLKGDGSVDTTPYLPRSVFDELFVKELQADGSYAIRAKFTLYSDGEVASKGAASGQGTGGSGVSYDRLDSWNDYDAGAGAVLSATLGYGLLSDINALRTDVTALKGAGFLTEHQDISHLLKKTDADAKYVTALGQYGDSLLWTKNGVSNSITLNYAKEALALRSTNEREPTPETALGTKMEISRYMNSGWWSSLTIGGANKSCNTWELCGPANTGDSSKISLRWRSGVGTFGDWKTILDNTNYASVLDADYVRKSGYTAADVLAKIKTVDGHGSGLDADTLDGIHNGELTAKYLNYAPSNTISRGVGFMQLSKGWNEYDAPKQGWQSVMKLAHGDGDTYYNRTLAFDFFSHKISTGCMRAGEFYGWKELAFTDSNVASATRLVTEQIYTAWGQTFFTGGVPKSVSGDLIGVGNVFLQNNIMWNKSGDGTYLWGGAGTGNESIFSLNTHSAGVFKKQLLKVTGDGNFGINVYTPTYLLHVGGSFCAAGAAQMNSTLTVDGAATLKSAVTVNGQLTATGNAIVRGTLDVNGILTATNKVRLYDELFFEPAGNAGPYLSPAGGKLSIAFHDNYTWVKTPIVLDKDGLLTLDGQLKIGGITMSYDASQGALRIEGNAYTTGGFAALGIPTLGAQYSETFVGRLCTGGEADEPVGAVIDFNDLSSLESFSGWNADGEVDVLFNLGYLGINEGVVREINGKSYADYGKIALAVTPLMVEKINQIDTSRTNMQKDIDDLKRRVYALEH